MTEMKRQYYGIRQAVRDVAADFIYFPNASSAWIRRSIDGALRAVAECGGYRVSRKYDRHRAVAAVKRLLKKQQDEGVET